MSSTPGTSPPSAAPPETGSAAGARRSWPRAALRAAGAIAIVAAVIADRALWASIAQWREDQSANLWLGYTQPLRDLPVGVVSSAEIPNPNGLPVLLSLLSRLPGLLAISTALGCLQAALLAAFAWTLLPRGRIRWAGLAILLSSTLLREIGAEAWNQWVPTLFNLAFFTCLIAWLRRPSWLLLPAFAFLILYTPALYLGAVVNSAGFALALAAAAWVRRPEPGRRAELAAGALGAAAVVIFLFALSWAPFFRAIPLWRIAVIHKYPLSERLWNGFHDLASAPAWLMSFWRPETVVSHVHGDEVLLAGSAGLARSALAWLLRAQTLAALLALGAAAAARARRAPGREAVVALPPGSGLAAALAVGFVVLAHLLNTVFSVFRWTFGERPDQVAQFAPFLLLAAFLGPLALPLPAAWRRPLARLTAAAGAAFVALSLGLGQAVIHLHHAYRGARLTEADVPLTDKRHAVEFIASWWKARGQGSRIAVEYLNYGRWPWATGFGKPLEQYYEENPMLTGRAFDYELRRLHGLENVAHRELLSPGGVAFAVTYAFAPATLPPEGGKRLLEVRDFGRLRVLVVADPAPRAPRRTPAQR